jgi:glycine/D-amino acid oxidase-like deaminating enzyme
MKVAVIGAGVIGAAVGWHLSRRGADVLFLDRGEPGAGVTDWTFSWVNASNKTQTRDYFELSVAGMSAHYRLAAEIGADGWWHPNGHLRWAGAGGTAEALQAKVSLLTSWGYDVTLWEAERVRRLLEPAVRFPADDTPVAVYFREGWIGGRALTAALVGGALQRGARALFGTPARDIVTARGRVTAVVTCSLARPDSRCDSSARPAHDGPESSPLRPGEARLVAPPSPPCHCQSEQSLEAGVRTGR